MVDDNRTVKRMFVLGLFAIIFLFVAYQLVHYLASFKTVTLIPKDNVSISLGYSTHDGSIGKVIVDSSSKTSIRVKRGQYTVLFHGKDISDRVEVMVVTSSASVEVPKNLSLTTKKLANLLDEQTSDIEATLASTIDLNAYRITYKNLYLDGSWGGFVFTPVDKSKDTVAIILHKLDNQWGVAAGPDIVISMAGHSDIPKSVVTSTNNRL